MENRENMNRENMITNLILSKDDIENSIINLNRVLKSIALTDGYSEEDRDNMRFIAYSISQLEDISCIIEALE